MYDPKTVKTNLNNTNVISTFENKYISEIYDILSSSPNGLSENEAHQRLLQIGENKLTEQKSGSKILAFLKCLKDILSILLFFAAFLAWISDSKNLSIAILIVVLMNAGFNVYQEWRAEKEMKALKSWIPIYAKIMRDGNLHKLPVKNIVPGDILFIEEGDRVPADIRLIESYDLFSIEIPLTGEFEPVAKKATKISANELISHESQISEKQLTAENMIYMSTSIARGTGKGIAVGTGMNTRFGQITHLAQEAEQPRSPLEREINYFSKYSFILSFIVGGIFFFIGYFLLELTIINAITFVIGVMIACVPEGLQATISSSLAMNTAKLAKKNVLMKRLSSVQTLGSVTLICTDKTGTLTKGEMTLKKIWTYNKPMTDISGVGYVPKGEFTISGRSIFEREHNDVYEILKIVAMCNTAKIEAPNENNKSWSIIGDSTDGAFLVAAIKYGINLREILQQEPLVLILPFDTDKKVMSSIHKKGSEYCAYTKGAAGKVMDLCSKIKIKNRIYNFSPSHEVHIRKIINQFGAEGLRIIAIASRDLSENFIPQNNVIDRNQIEKDMTFLGLAALKDPARLDVKESLEKVFHSGINVVMVTGDYGLTAKAIAKEVGLIEDEDHVKVITSDELDQLSDEAIIKAIHNRGTIFSRTNPAQKLRIVRVARKSGEIVAVTGDGANDAAALHHADIGISMGLSGTDIAKESSDMILTDDSFKSIVNGIEGGRNIWMNLRKFIYYVYTHNWAQLIPYILFVVFATPLPILAIHILIMDLGIEILPSLALGRDPPESNIMELNPRKLQEHLFKSTIFIRSLLIGTIIGLLGFYLCINAWILGGWHLGLELSATDPIYCKGITMMYASIVVGQIANLLTCRKTNSSLFKIHDQPNSWIYYGIIWQLGILALTIYVPFLQSIMSTYPLSGLDWLKMLILPIAIIPIQEIWRRISNRKARLHQSGKDMNISMKTRL